MTMEVFSLSKSYSGRILFQDVSFSAQSGLISLIGKSGTGKSTFLKVLIGEERPDGGMVGYESGRPDFAFSGCDQDSLIVDFSFEENYLALFGDKCYSLRTERLISLLCVTSLTKKRILELSGGERRKASLILALSKEADFYCLDEPLLGMDDASRKGLSIFLDEFSKTHLVFVATHEIEGTGLSPDGILDFNRKGKIIRLTKGTIPEKNGQKKRNSKTGMVPVRSLFRFTPFYSVLFLLMTAFSFLFLSLGFSFTEFRTEQESTLLSLEQDCFAYHSLSFPKDGIEYSSLPNELLEKGVFSYSFSVDGNGSYLFPLLTEDRILQCSGDRKYASVSFTEGSVVTEQKVEYCKEVSILDSFFFSTIYEGKKNGNLFLCSQNLLEKFLLSDSVFLDGQRISIPLYFALKKEEGVFYTGLSGPNVKVEQGSGIALPFSHPETMVFRSAGNNVTFSSPVTSSVDSFVHIGIREYQFLLLSSGNANVFYAKSEIKGLINRYPGLKIQDILPDYARKNVIGIGCFVLFWLFFACDVTMLLFSGKILRSWKINLSSFYRLNSLRTKKRDTIFLALYLCGPAFLFCFVSYLSWMIPFSNGILWKLCHPETSLLLKYYPEFYGTSIPYLRISWQGLLALAFFFFGLILSIYVCFGNFGKKKTR